MNANNKKSVNVLSLDGGGVRGLSTLIILRKLLCLVNQKLDPTRPKDQPIHPREVFDLIVGTSTGGLIALMMVKFDMSVDECISQYKELSRKIFKQWHILGYMSGGLGAVTKFSSGNLEKVLLENVIRPGRKPQGIEPEQYLMEHKDNHSNIMCSVVCNELHPETKERKQNDAVFICSHWEDPESDESLICTLGCRRFKDKNKVTYFNKDKVPVVAAARATSAAPTYFKHVKLLGKLLVDGGFGITNNPSHAAYEHYFGGPSRLLDYQYVRMVNIGTGTQPDDWVPKKSFIHHLPIIRGLASLLKGLTKIATDSEYASKVMHLLADTNKDQGLGILKFHRFSADCGGIHLISLYDYRAISKLEEITEEYLRKEEVIAKLEEYAEELAQTCRSRRERGQPATSREHHVVFSEITETETGTEVIPQIILSEPSDNEIQQNEAHNEHENMPGSPPELTDASSRGSFDRPLTPIGDTRPGRNDGQNLLTTAYRLLTRRWSQKRGTSAPDSTTVA